GPESFSEGTIVYINRDHPLYKRECKKADAHHAHRALVDSGDFVDERPAQSAPGLRAPIEAAKGRLHRRLRERSRRSIGSSSSKRLDRREQPTVLILLKSPPFILREPQDERRSGEIVGDFPFKLSIVEAFLGFSAESNLESVYAPIPNDFSSLRKYFS